MCIDGSCRKEQHQCPPFDGCKYLNKPYLCGDGVCTENKEECDLRLEVLGECTTGTARCEDGICRKDCPHFNGCGKDKPLSCPNGYCAKDESECAGESLCPSDKPFRCNTNECVTDRYLCKTAIRLHNTQEIILNISPFDTKDLEFIMDIESNMKFASLTIASGALIPSKLSTVDNPKPYDKTDLYNRQVALTPVPDSMLQHLKHYILPEKKEYVRKFFPLYSGKELNHHLSVRSTVINITDLSKKANESEEALPYKFPFILTLAVDVPAGADKELDFALGKADIDNGLWKPDPDFPINKYYEDNKFAFELSEDGIYAVLFYPRDKISDAEADCNLLCQYQEQIIYGAKITAIVVLMILYVFWRIKRYIHKYGKQKKQLKNLEGQIHELKANETQIEGQTVEDKLDGIEFTVNPLFGRETERAQEDKVNELLTLIGQLKLKEQKMRAKNKDFRDKNDTNKAEIAIIKQQIEDLEDEMGVEVNKDMDDEGLDFGDDMHHSRDEEEEEEYEDDDMLELDDDFGDDGF